MRTSDATIAACMELLHGGFVNLRGFGSIDATNTEEQFHEMRPVLQRWTAPYHAIVRRLMEDPGDEAVAEAMSGLGWDLVDWKAKVESFALVGKKLVADEIKFRVFEYIEKALRFALEYDVTVRRERPDRLYWEMDRAHNVPREIYAEKQSTKYGNLVNR
jgi:hypothetical protein